MKKIPLTQGKFAIVDDEDWREVLSWGSWSFCENAPGHGVAVKVRNRKGIKTTIYMHRIILGITNPNIKVDHANGNSLDNRKENLRATSQKNNTHNRVRQKGSLSRYKGVSLESKRNMWRARIRKDKKELYLGCFDTEEDAARVYDGAARSVYGEFATYNFPKKGERSAITGEIQK